MDILNKYGFYIAIGIGPETKHSGVLASYTVIVWLAPGGLKVSLVLLVSTKNGLKLYDYCYDVNDKQVNTKRIKLIVTLTIQVQLIC